MMPHEFRYLWELANHGPLTADELARGDQTAQGVATQLRSMVDRGLVRDTMTEAGVKSYSATPAGRKIADA